MLAEKTVDTCKFQRVGPPIWLMFKNTTALVRILKVFNCPVLQVEKLICDFQCQYTFGIREGFL